MVPCDAKATEPSLDVMRWGLVPFWAKDIKVGFSNINAKAEGIEGKPAFCVGLIPAAAHLAQIRACHLRLFGADYLVPVDLSHQLL